MDNVNCIGACVANENNSYSHHSGSIDHQGRSIGSCDNNAIITNDDHWEELRRLLSDFHHLVDVELPTLLQNTLASAARMDQDRHGHDETSDRHHFDLRRCFRNMQELLLREDLLDLLDENNVGEGKDEHGIDKDSLRFSGNGSSPNNACVGADKNDSSLLLEMFADDLVQLSSISIFDDAPDDGYSNTIGDSSVRELHRSLVVLAAHRFPVRATLDDDQISQLLSRVLSLIQQESFRINQQCHQKISFDQHCGNDSRLRDSCQRPRKDFEPLQSLLTWLNREMTVERLSQGVLRDPDETAMAVQIPLKFLDQMAIKQTAFPSSVEHPSHEVLPPQVVLSVRILIDLLLGALNSIVVPGHMDCNTSRNSNTNDSCGSGLCSLREWMSASSRILEHHGSLSGSEVENRNDHLDLLKLLDRYALELVEETLELLRPHQRKPPPRDFQLRDRNLHEPAAGQNRHSYGNSHDANQHPGAPITNSTQSRKQRVVKVLQHAAMTTNFFSIMEPKHTTVDGNTCCASGTSALVFVGLSRSFWRALARFVIEEVDHLDDNFEGSVQHWDNERAEDVEDCLIAATDVLFRLTKTQVRAILFQDREETSHGGRDSNPKNDSQSFRDKTTIPPTFCLSEEELSIIATTILRLLGQPDLYWTAETQTWVATLLRLKKDDNADDRSSSSIAPSVDVASKLRKVLQTALICTSYVPDALPLEQQHRIHSSLRELLLAPTTSTRLSRRKRKHIDAPPTESTADAATLTDDPWESFWAIRQ